MIIRLLILFFFLNFPLTILAKKIDLIAKDLNLKIHFFEDDYLSFNTKFDGQNLFIYFNHPVEFSVKDLLKQKSSNISQIQMSNDRRSLYIQLKHKGYKIFSSINQHCKTIELIKIHTLSSKTIIPIARPQIKNNIAAEPTKNSKIVIEKLSDDNSSPQLQNNCQYELGEKNQKWFINFSNLVSSAIFRKNNFLWIIFNDKVDLNFDQVKNSNDNIKNYIILPNNKYTILRIEYNKFPSVKTYRQNFSWIIELTQDDVEPLLKPFKEIKEQNVENSTNKIFSIGKVSSNLNLLDPEKGTLLEIILSYDSSIGKRETYITPEYEILNSAQGLAIELKSDLIEVKVNEKGVILITDDLEKFKSKNIDLNDTVIDKIEQEIDTYNLAPSIIDFQYEEGDFVKGWLQTLAKTFDNSTNERLNKSFGIIKFYTAHGFYHEALSLFNLITKNKLPISQDNKFLIYGAFLNFMRENYSTSLEILNSLNQSQLLPNQLEEINFYKKINQYQLKILKEPIDYRFYYTKFIQFYPLKLQYDLTTIAIKYFLEHKDFKSANFFIEQSLDNQKNNIIKNKFLFYKALLAEQEDKIEQAKTIYNNISQDSDDNFNRAKSLLNLVKLQLKDHTISYLEAVKKLETAQFIWRGGDLEVEIISYLADLHNSNKNYIGALKEWRKIGSNFAHNDEYLSIAFKMSNLFTKLFENEDNEDNLSAIKSLAIYYEFKELTPIGAKGDALAANLVNKAIKLDLIDEAIKVLEYQIKYRLTDIQREEAIDKIIKLYIKDQKFDEALQYVLQADLTTLTQTNYKLRAERSRLKAKILAKKGQYQLALKLIENDESIKADKIRVKIFWLLEDWINLEKYILYKLANPTGKETHNQIADDLLKLAISYDKQNKNPQILNIFHRYPNILTYNKDLENKLFLLLDLDKDNSFSFASIIRGLNLSTIENLLNEAKK